MLFQLKLRLCLFGLLFLVLSPAYGQICEVEEGAEDCNDNGIADVCEVVPLLLQRVPFFADGTPRQHHRVEIA